MAKDFSSLRPSIFSFLCRPSSVLWFFRPSSFILRPSDLLQIPLKTGNPVLFFGKEEEDGGDHEQIVPHR